MKTLTTILIIDLCPLWWAHAEPPPPPPPPVLTALEVSTNQTSRVGEPYAICWSHGVTSVVDLIQADHPEDPPLPKVSGPTGGFSPKKEPFRPFYRVKVWNDLVGDYIEFRSYAPGNTGFFQAELVTE